MRGSRNCIRGNHSMHIPELVPFTHANQDSSLPVPLLPRSSLLSQDSTLIQRCTVYSFKCHLASMLDFPANVRSCNPSVSKRTWMGEFLPMAPIEYDLIVPFQIPRPQYRQPLFPLGNATIHPLHTCWSPPLALHGSFPLSQY